MSQPKRTAAMLERRRHDSETKLARVEAEIDAAIARGEIDIAISEIRRRAKVSRTFIYDNHLDAVIRTCFREAAERQAGKQLAEAQVTGASLRAEYETLKQIVKRQAREITTLKAKLSEHLGQKVRAQVDPLNNAEQLAAEQQRRIAQLEHDKLALSDQVEHLEAQLEAAVELNRDLTRRQNTRGLGTRMTMADQPDGQLSAT